MFEARIVVHASDAIFKLIDSLFIKLAPKEIRNPFDPTGKMLLKFKPVMIHSDTVEDLDDFRKAPHLLVYFFDSHNKQEFLKNEADKIKQWKKDNNRECVPTQVIFIDNPKKTKTNNFFGTGSNYVPFLQQEVEDLIIYQVKSDGSLKKKLISESWEKITENVKMGLLKRIETLKSITRTPTTLHKFKLTLLLAGLFNDLGLSDMSNAVIVYTRSIIEQIETDYTDCFMNKNSFTHQFDVKVSSKETESVLEKSKKVPLYDVMFILLKKQVECLQKMNNSDQIVQTLWDFFISIYKKVTTTDLIPEVEKKLWMTEQLQDIITFCSQEVSNGHKNKVNILTSAFEWYLKLLPEIYQEKDQIPSPPDFRISKTTTDGLASEEGFNACMQKGYERLGGYYTLFGNIRNAAVAASYERKYRNNKEKEVSLIVKMMKPSIISQTASIISPTEAKDFMALNEKDMLKSAARSLVSGTDEAIPAAETISEYLAKESKVPTDIKISIPMYITVDDSLQLIKGENAAVKATFHSCFKQPIKCNKIDLILAGFEGEEKSRPVETLTVESGEISDGSVVEFTGVFKNAGMFKPEAIYLYSGKTKLHINLLQVDTFITVDEPPPPFNVFVKLPEYLLPSWQHALITFVLAKPQTLSLKVSGIQANSSPLRLQDGNEIKATKGAFNTWVFSDVPEGTHDLYMPVHADKAGELKIEVKSPQHQTERTQHYEVSDFLTIAVVYKPSSSVAMLTAYTDAAREMRIEACTFLDAAGKHLDSEATGVPAPVGTSPRTALFEIGGNPETACVTLSQKGLKPFTLRFNIDIVEDSEVAPPPPKVVAPLTTILPETSNLIHSM